MRSKYIWCHYAKPLPRIDLSRIAAESGCYTYWPWCSSSVWGSRCSSIWRWGCSGKWYSCCSSIWRRCCSIGFLRSAYWSWRSCLGASGICAANITHWFSRCGRYISPWYDIFLRFYWLITGWVSWAWITGSTSSRSLGRSRASKVRRRANRRAPTLWYI